MELQDFGVGNFYPTTKLHFKLFWRRLRVAQNYWSPSPTSRKFC